MEIDSQETNRLIGIAQSIQDWVVKTRQDLHRIPETRYQTKKTREYIKNCVAQLDPYSPKAVRLTRDILGGIVVDVFQKEKAPIVLFRADFDALPVPEETGLPFSSTHPSISHACGHDVHTAMLLGLLKCVGENKVRFGYNLRLVFQDAEENPGTSPVAISGGEQLVLDRVLHGVSRAYALHIWNSPEATPGVFFSRPGAMLGNSGRMKVVVKAEGGHVAEPHNGSNALRITQAIQNRLDSFATRHLSPVEPVSIEPTILKSGSASNVMAAEAELWYGVRTMLPRDRHENLMEELADEVEEVAKGLGGTAECFPIMGHPSLINNEMEFGRVRDTLERAGQKTEVLEPVLGGEDFAYYLQKVPGCMWMLGAHTPGTGNHHSPTFNPDESVLWKGVLFWLLLGRHCA